MVESGVTAGTPRRATCSCWTRTACWASASALARWKASYRLPICDKYSLNEEGSTWGMFVRVTGGMSRVDGGRWPEGACADV